MFFIIFFRCDGRFAPNHSLQKYGKKNELEEIKEPNFSGRKWVKKKRRNWHSSFSKPKLLLLMKTNFYFG
jgi:hypothetical protein